MAKLISKTLHQELNALEDHAEIVRDALLSLRRGSGGRIRLIATELRNLVCYSSGVDGLAWRLLRRFGVSDEVELFGPQNTGSSNVPASGQLVFDYQPILISQPQGFAATSYSRSLEILIKQDQAVSVRGQSITYERLIKSIAEQMGTGHEPPGIERQLADINSILMDNEHVYFPIFQALGYLTLHVVERILQAAARSDQYRRLQANPIDLPLADCGTESLQHQLPAPARELHSDTGGFAFVVGLPTDQRWRERGQRVRFPPVQSGGVRVQAWKTRRDRFVVRIDGLLVPNFECNRPVPPLPGENFLLAVSWNRLDIQVFVNGARL